LAFYIVLFERDLLLFACIFFLRIHVEVVRVYYVVGSARK